ncbi:MAG: lysozyme [Parvibaculum sp.]|nr:lysozyme [Parvibaculum sp.]
MIPAALKGRLAQAAGGGAVAIAMAVVIWFEGVEPEPYIDPVGIPTVCVGHTGSVDMGRLYSGEECEALLQGDLGAAFAAVDRGVTVPLRDETRAALASFVFNVGAGAFQRSTLLRRLNAGEGAPACDELLKWTYAGGRQLPGLVNRRKAEHELCRAGFERVAANDNVPIPLAPPVRTCKA